MDNPFNEIPDRIEAGGGQESDSSTKSYLTKDDVLKIATIFGAFVLGVFILYLVYAGICAIGEQAEVFFRHIRKLFAQAPNVFRTPKGFGAFIQLVLIAVFVGWATKRLLRRK